MTERVRHEIEQTEDVMLKVVEAMRELKANDIVSLDLREIHTAVTDYFVICHAQSKTQVEAVADKIIDKLRDEMRVKPYHSEGFENAEWILIDYIDVIVYVFLEPKRSFYDIEGLWADAKCERYDED